jgi:hypothetical protein
MHAAAAPHQQARAVTYGSALVATCASPGSTIEMQMKHLQYTSKTDKTLETCVYSHSNMCNTRSTFKNIQMKHLQHTSETDGTPFLRDQQMEHLKHTLETCIYSHCNMCNTKIYF